MDGRLPRDDGTTGGVDGAPGSGPPTTEQVLLAHACRVLAARGLAEDVLGHVSLRTAGGLLVRGRGPAEEGLLLTQPADVREVGPDALPGHREDDGWAVPNELPIHTEVLRARPDVDRNARRGMQHAAVLHVGALADDNRGVVGPEDRVEPDRRARLDMDVADQRGGGGNERAWVDRR